MAFVKQVLVCKLPPKIWICCLCVMCVLMGILQASAQVRPPRRKQRILVDPGVKKKDTLKADIGASLKDIAKRATQHSEPAKVDVVFVVDVSKRMLAPVAILEKRLIDMLAVIEAQTMDYRFAFISFQSVRGEPKYIFHQWSFDYISIENALRETRVEADNAESGYGLDAVVKGLNALDFREGVTTQFVVVSNSPMRTSWTEADAKSRISEQIVNLCRQNNVQLNFIGTSEKTQAELTDRTSGKWYPIDSYQRRMDGQRIQSGETVADKALLRVDGVFKRIAENLVQSELGKVDIVFVFDYSLSMEPKTDAACNGLDLMVSVFKSAGLDYRLGIIRFWAAVGGGESTIVVTKPPLEPDQVKSMFRLPKSGDEHLLDAVIEGVPKLQTEQERDLVLIIVTDEATSKRAEKGYTAGKAVSVCRGARARVYVIGGVTSMKTGSIGDDFQRQVAQLTKGEHYIMPGASAPVTTTGGPDQRR
ncbi:VWA domain-containing protein [Candidatus Poribacteria bacterium]|nr:VWA domain-containing protein [Candidatus Poribacteria bacterium]MYH80858.1 VWA domain-containing protein [Candidatus Poribacteria bacterium]MYK93744.1 VWA domain-containing protein [Candidatus Poribacteria bacterium]